MRTANVSQLEFGAVAGGSQLEANSVNGDQATPAVAVAKHDALAERPWRPSAKSKACPAVASDRTSALETLLTFVEAARVLGISLRQFRRLVDGGKIAFVKVSE